MDAYANACTGISYRRTQNPLEPPLFLVIYWNPKNLATVLIGEGKFVLGIGSQCALGRGDVALWGLGNSFCTFRGNRLFMGGRGSGSGQVLAADFIWIAVIL